MSDTALKLLHLRRFSVVGCATHGPFSRDMQGDCEPCELVKSMREERAKRVSERLTRAVSTS